MNQQRFCGGEKRRNDNNRLASVYKCSNVDFPTVSEMENDTKNEKQPRNLGNVHYLSNIKNKEEISWTVKITVLNVTYKLSLLSILNGRIKEIIIR